MEKNNIEILDADAKEVEALPPALINQSEIDMQISTAKKYPRSIRRFQQEALSLATINEETAARCFYVLRRGDKKIEGPGIRLAEIIANSWGNLRYGARFVGESEDRRSVIAEGYAYDLEKNVASAIQVSRRITDKRGARFKDDIVEVTKNAAASIALRNAIFKVIPMAFVQEIYERAKEVAVGKASSLADRRVKMVEHFSKFGVSLDRILKHLNKNAIEDIDLKDMEELVGISTAIKDGETDIDAAFPVLKPVESQPKTLEEKLKSKADETKKGKTAKEIADDFEPGSEG